ncbi:MAG: hypothetical protein HFG90_07425 [Acholeplasmatales bacterium]|jgi:hypothetical protein|nr:hypothetical protein [Acholeplasmatales bacterium]
MAKIEEILKNNELEFQNKEERIVYEKEYIPLKDVGELIFKYFKTQFVPGKGYALDSDANKDKFGILSNLMALSTLLELDSVDVDITDFSKEFCFLTERFFESIYQTGDEEVYDASPYLFNNKDKNIWIDSYVETISKSIIVLTDMRSFLLDSQKNVNFNLNVKVRGKTYCDVSEFIPLIEECLIHSIIRLNDACIENDNQTNYSINNKVIERDNLSSVIKYKGWAFQKSSLADSKAYDSSIYFSYHATNAFLSFYSTFNICFDEFYEHKKIPSYKLRKDSKLKQNKLFFDKYIDIISDFRYKVVCSGRYFEKQLQNKSVDIAVDYIKWDLNPLSLSSVLELQDSSAPLNTLLILAIFINSGLDDDYDKINQKKYFQEQIQFALANVKKTYSFLKRESREDLITSYVLKLLERCPKEDGFIIQQLRAAYRQSDVYSLPALYCNTYANISEFLIQYPQKEMSNNLEWIMENRNNTQWYWDKNGFNINNNLYYLFALEKFYDYYKVYEEPFLDSARTIQLKDNEIVSKDKQIIKIEEEHAQELLNKENEHKNELLQQKSLLDQAIDDIICKAISGEIQNFFREMITQAEKFALEQYKYMMGQRLSPENLFDDKKYDKARYFYYIVFGKEFTNYLKKSSEDIIAYDETKASEAGILNTFEQIINENITSTFKLNKFKE